MNLLNILQCVYNYSQKCKCYNWDSGMNPNRYLERKIHGTRGNNAQLRYKHHNAIQTRSNEFFKTQLFLIWCLFSLDLVVINPSANSFRHLSTSMTPRMLISMSVTVGPCSSYRRQNRCSNVICWPFNAHLKQVFILCTAKCLEQDFANWGFPCHFF